MERRCEFCNGSGQISLFQGVSRFLLSQEECPHCAGLGVVIEPDEPGAGAAECRLDSDPEA